MRNLYGAVVLLSNQLINHGRRIGSGEARWIASWFPTELTAKRMDESDLALAGPHADSVALDV